MCPFPPRMSISRFPGVLLEKSSQASSRLCAPCSELPQEDEPGLWSLGIAASSQVPLPPSEGMFAIRASRMEPLSSSPPSRARGNLILLKDWLLGHYCSIQVDAEFQISVRQALPFPPARLCQMGDLFYIFLSQTRIFGDFAICQNRDR